jgi:ABC-type Fe3+/spermidine/putrescine transport system ATPase subunit
MQATKVSHLTKKIGSLAALNDISLSVGEGFTFEFLGPNGAGKTSTIRILTGVSRPAAGTAAIFCHDIEHNKITARLSIDIVSENSNVYNDLTAWQNMMFSAELFLMRRKAQEEKTIQSVQSIEVSFDHNSVDQPDELSHLSMVNEAQKAGDKFKLYIENPSEVIDTVVDYAQMNKLKIISITILGPSLEDVFTRSIGLQRGGEGIHAID